MPGADFALRCGHPRLGSGSGSAVAPSSEVRCWRTFANFAKYPAFRVRLKASLEIARDLDSCPFLYNVYVLVTSSVFYSRAPPIL